MVWSPMRTTARIISADIIPYSLHFSTLLFRIIVFGKISNKIKKFYK